jgi:hypothetical protein
MTPANLRFLYSFLHSEPIFPSCLSLLMFKWVFKGVSQCVPAVSNTLLWSIQPLPLFALILLRPTLRFSTAFGIFQYLY